MNIIFYSRNCTAEEAKARRYQINVLEMKRVCSRQSSTLETAAHKSYFYMHYTCPDVYLHKQMHYKYSFINVNTLQKQQKHGDLATKCYEFSFYLQHNSCLLQSTVGVLHLFSALAEQREQIMCETDIYTYKYIYRNINGFKSI